ncbi:MAG: hypothetical protein ABI770_07570, partial [Sphingomicrobium sp.]
MKAGAIALGALFWAAPLLAQQQDPLAPLPTSPNPIPPPPGGSSPTAIFALPPAPQPAATVLPTIAVPTDWRGVFDAIDSQNWTAAQAGIAALPPGILAPVAKADLYTAKGSPVVVLASLRSLIAQSPELPQANQLAAMAFTRGATDPILVVPERRTINLGSAPGRYRAKPVPGEPAADQLRATLDPLVKADDASGAEAQLLVAAPQLSGE